MELTPLTLVTPKIKLSEILPALELIMSEGVIEEAIVETNSQEKRNRLLPTHLIIALVIALNQQSHILGRIPKNAKFPRVQELPDGSYLSWINPDRKSKKKGASRIRVRVIEYLIVEQGEEVIYRTKLTNILL